LHPASTFEAAAGFPPLPFQLAWVEQGEESAPIRTLGTPTGLGMTLATLVGWLWDRQQRPQSTAGNRGCLHPPATPWQAAGGSVKLRVTPVLVTAPGELPKGGPAEGPDLLQTFRAAALKQRRRRSSSRPSTCLSAAKSIASISRHKWISGPITTVRHERMSPKAPAVVRVGLTAWRWFSESSRSGKVVLGNHPHSVSGTPQG